ncbi:MAG: L,D-transpeptidase family protein [Rhodospirillales bacterium]|nr:L,D-transpeptidase family protein [Rhodospirillales bacterium]
MRVSRFFAPGRWASVSAAVSAAFLVTCFNVSGASAFTGTIVNLETPPDPIELEAGQFVWLPDRASDGEIRITVSLPEQVLHVHRNGVLIAVSTVSTGRPGYATPAGEYTILQKKKEHFSNLYDDAPMPFMQRLTWDGLALHAGRLPGRPASHGCIRLPKAFAPLLYGITRHGSSVVVIDAEMSSAEWIQREALTASAPIQGRKNGRRANTANAGATHAASKKTAHLNRAFLSAIQPEPALLPPGT